MKKHLFSIFTVLAFCLISCSNGSNPVEPPHEHTFSEAWNFDDTYHWHDSTCGHDAVSGKGMHNFGDWIIEEDATEYKEGSKYKLCSVCSYRKYEKIDFLEHTHKPGEPVEENKIDATCTKDGSYDLVIRCKECHEIISSEHMIIKALDHDYQLTHTEPATYEHDGELTYTCSRCGNSYTTKGDDKLVHHYSSEWSIDYQKGTHYHACTDRGYENERSDEAPHEFFDVVTSPTHLEGGYTTHTCKVCGYSYTDTITDRVPYVVTFNLNGGTSTKLVARQEVFNFKQIYFVFDCKKDEYSFRGWSYKDEQVFDETGKQLKTIEMEDNMVFTAIFRQAAYVKITTNMSQAGEIKGAGEYPYNSYVDLSVTPYQGYVFAGWYYQGTLLSNYLSYRYLMWDTDVTLEARFALDSYKLNIHTNNEEYGLVLLKYSHTYTTTTVDYGNGTSVSVTTTTTTVENKENKPVYETNYDFGSSVQIAAYSKTDVRFLGWYDEDNNLVSNKAVYSFSMPNHDYTLEAKWNHFKINYNLNGGTNSDSNPAFYTIDESVSLGRPSRYGYNFIGWKYHDEYITTIDSSWLSDVTIDAIWEATTYQINYHLNGGTNNVDNPLTYTIETPTITLLSPERTGYTFDGWYSDAEFNTSVTSIKKGSIGDINLYAKWNVIIYSITYELNGGINDESNPSTYTIESSISLANPSRVGYQFSKWTDAEGNIVSTISKGTIGDLVLTANWLALKNKLIVISEDEEMGSVLIKYGNGYSGEQVTVIAIPKEGYAFDRWVAGEYSYEYTTASKRANYTFTMPTNDYKLTACFYTLEDLEKDYAQVKLSEDGSTIRYGLYPQTVVSDTSLINELDALPSNYTNSTTGYTHYNDEYYYKMTATPFIYYGKSVSFHEFDNGNSISRQQYWFKCEPIEWKILKDSNGSLYCLSTRILDIHNYSEHLISYPGSEIHSWLNNHFYNLAFNISDSYIETTLVDNSAATMASNNSFATYSTNSKVFLPSYQDYLNEEYGFGLEPTRISYPTDFAKARGFYYGYWTRSPSSKNVWHVGSNGGLTDDRFAHRVRAGYDYYYQEYEYVGVRPAITIKVS